MESRPRPAITPQLVIGVFITALGVILTLQRTNLIEPRHLELFWPLALMALGTSLILRRQDSRGRFWGIFWASLGCWLMFKALGLIQVGIGDLIVPLVLILIGGTLVSRTVYGAKPPGTRHGPLKWEAGGVPPIPSTSTLPGDQGRVSLFTIMGEAKRSSSDKPFLGGEMTAFMGGCVLDLRQAEIPPGGQASLNILAVMAGHEIWVPQGWTVASDVVPLLGGVDDKRLPPLAQAGTDAPRLVLKGFVLMGGVVVKN
jgi:cell wall-active antibiotic response 4TMS protein YvqF